MSKIEIPKLSDYKNLFKENKEIEGFSDFFRGYIKNILEETNQEKFKKEDFELFDGYTENLKNYKKIVDEEIGENIDINIVEKFTFGQTEEEFRDFIKNYEIFYLIEYGKKENIEIFFGENGIIKTKEELEDLLNYPDIDKLIYLIKKGKKEKIEIFFGKNGIIKTAKELEYLLNHPNINRLIYLIILLKKEKIEIFFGKNGIIKTAKELEDLFENNQHINIIVYFIKYGKNDNLKTFIEKFNIEKLDDLFNLDIYKKIEHLKKSIKNNSEYCISEIKELDSNNENKYNIEIGNCEKNIGTCSKNEKYNYEILSNKNNNNFKTITINKEIIGIIKTKGEKSFLSFKNVFDKKGDLIFMKGWIYNLVVGNNEIGNLDVFDKKSIELTNIKNLTRNPIKKIKRKNNQELYDNFNKLVDEFIKKI